MFRTHLPSPLWCAHGVLALSATILPAPLALGAEQVQIPATAYVLPKQTTSEGSGYFSIIAGRNARLYIGTAKYG